MAKRETERGRERESLWFWYVGLLLSKMHKVTELGHVIGMDADFIIRNN